MKQIWLIRHANARDAEHGQRDQERLLTPEGERTAARMGKHLRGLYEAPQALIASTAERAKATAQRLAEQYDYDEGRIIYEPELYEASVRTLLQYINGLKPDWDRVFLVAHNPTLPYLAEYLTGENVGGFSPGTAACLTHADSDWALWSQGNVSLAALHDPAQIGP